MNKGFVYVFTGNGKGKTSAAFWTAMRAVLRGARVAVVQWYKEARWPTAEQEIAKLFTSTTSTTGTKSTLRLRFGLAQRRRSGQASRTGSFEVYLSGRGFYKLPTDHAAPAEHRKAAQDGLELARKLITSGRYFAVILDEVNNAVKDKLIQVSEVIEVIEKRGRTHLILTGRGAHKNIIEKADLVTEMKKIKHPFDKGKKAVRGLDY